MIDNNVRPETAPALTPERREAAIELLERDIETLCAFRDQYRAHQPGGAWYESRAWYAERITAARAAIAFLRETADLVDAPPFACPACGSEDWSDCRTDSEGLVWEEATCGNCGAVTDSTGILYRIETRPAEGDRP